MTATVLAPSLATLERLETRAITGRVAAVRGLAILADALPLPVGSVVRLPPPHPGAAPIRGEVVGFEGHRSVVMLFDGADRIAPGAPVTGEQPAGTLPVGDAMLGRVIDALGRPIDGGPPVPDCAPRPLRPAPTVALRRRRIDEPLPTGIRVVDALVTLGRGQRIGIFSGPGVGKSTLVGAIARHARADVSVIALVGERGREVREFLEASLGPEGRARSVVVVATGDESPLLRVRAAEAACTVAEHFRDRGADVVLMMDSITRFAQAQRQVGLTVGEHPAMRGYTPSVFARLSALLERAGAIEDGGSITGLYAVLVEGDDLNEPVSDAARGILDGHLALSRRLAGRGHHPAVDLLESVSRVADAVCDPAHVAARREVLRLAAAYAESEELIRIGAYAAGSDHLTDVAIALREDLNAFLQQDPTLAAGFPESCRDLLALAEKARRQLAVTRRTGG